MNIRSVVHRYVLKACATMAPFRAIALILIPMSLVGCTTTQPGTDGFRTTTGGPVAQSDPISVGLRDNLEGQSGYAIGRRVALIIGNSDYQGSISSLINPANDAHAMAASLKDVGFEVDLLLDATRDEIKEAVYEFSDKLHDSDVGLFYYAGHAVQVDGKNFLIPVGANFNINNERQDSLARYIGLKTVDINEILGSMENADPDLSIVILDSCRDNPFAGGTRGLSRGLAQTFAPRGTFVAYATAPGEVAEDGRGRNSPYTSALVEAIKTPGLKLEDVFKQVRREVALQTDGRQTPWENSSIFGDFYFSPPAPTPEPAPVVATPTPEAPPPAPTPEPAPAIAATPDVDPKPAPVPPAQVQTAQPQAPAPVDQSETVTRSNRPKINTTFITP